MFFFEKWCFRSEKSVFLQNKSKVKPAVKKL